MKNRIRALALLSLALALPACASAPAAGLPGGAPGGAARAGHPGFDLQRYPGEAALRSWRASSPYRWVGYYLPAPCHRSTSWMGARPTLERLGWGVAILYVGQQAFEGDTAPPAPGGPIVCSRTLLTAEQGRIDGADAVAKARAEGFAPGSVIYLDVERMREVPAGMAAYYQAWQGEVLRDGGYLPGTYAHRDNASALFALAQAAWLPAGRAGSPPFWVAGGPGFTLDQPAYASGFPFATAWQGALDVQRTWGGVSLSVDENVASRPSPSAPLQP